MTRLDLQLWTVALFFFGMGIAALVRPGFVVGFFGMTTDEADARSEVRAVYGGFGLAVAGVLLATLYDPEIREGVTLAIAVSLIGMACGRVVSALIERPGRWPLVFFGVELVLAALLLF